MQPPDGIVGRNPREHSSPEVGKRIVELGAEAIGRKARALFASFPEDQRTSRLKAVSPEHWWLV
jgi:hypothetical protein